MNKKPFISFVVTARNDNYGGNWINRINAFIKVLTYQAERTKLPCELIFVEYNPPQDKKHMYEELDLKKSDYLSFKFIVIPNEFHKTLPNNDKVTVCEFIGKNIGIRRSLGDWIIATNPDVLYSNELFDFFSSNALNSNYYYRINRFDISLDKIDSSISVNDILSIASKKTIKIMYNWGTLYTSFGEWLNTFIHGRTKKLFLQCPIWNQIRLSKGNNDTIHTNTAGDFLCMHKTAWEKSRGYDQMTVGSGVLDGYILYVLYCHGYKQQILPYKLFHIYHHHKGVTYLASHKKFYEDAKLMLKTKQPYKINPENWGFPEQYFEEIIL